MATCFFNPLFLYVAEPEKANEPSFLETFKSGLQAVIQIPGLLRFLIARMFYADALVVFAMGGIYVGLFLVFYKWAWLRI